MQKLAELKVRMKTVTGIQSVARTMATVSSAKLSRTRNRASGMRQYTERIERVLTRQVETLASTGADPQSVSPYFALAAQPKRTLLLHISGDRGMCGNYNVAIDRAALMFVEERQAADAEVSVVAKGAKGERYLRRKTTARIVDAEPWSRAGVTTDEVGRIHEIVTRTFLSGEVDEVYCAYTRFYSPIRRVPRVVRLLPLEARRGAQHSAGRARTPPAAPAWAYEPSFEGVVEELVSLFVRARIEDVLLESYASEQGARMIAMEEATERAGKMLHGYQVQFNRVRREVITGDLIAVLFASLVVGTEGLPEQGSGTAAHEGALT